MPRAQQQVVFSDHDTCSWFIKASFGQDKETFRTLALTVPGFTTDRFPSCRIPIECAGIAAKAFEKCGYRVVDSRSRRSAPSAKELSHPIAHPYQRKAAERMLRKRVLLVAHEMGLGKCLTTILALQRAEFRNALIVCPANVRSVWLDELKKWWPEHPEARTLETGKQVSTFEAEAPIAITSYGLLHKLPPIAFNVLVLDESHYFANAQQAGRPVQRSKAVRDLCNGNRGAIIWALTGTPITNEPINLHNQLDILWPGRFGKYWDFAHHYCNVDATDYTDYWVHGVNLAYASELEERLKSCVDRRTGDEPEVRAVMPPFVVTPVRVKADRKFKPRELWESLSRLDFHREKEACDAIVRACGEQKIGEAISWGADVVETGKRLCILTHLKQTAKDIEAGLLKKHVRVWRFDGDTNVRGREAIITTALKSPEPGVLVCTMHSVKEGINTLAGFDAALFAELYYTPGVMKQALKRFHRASASCPVWILYVEGSHEEIIAMRLEEKIRNESKLLKRDKAGKELLSALDQEEDEEEMFKRLRSIAKSRVEEDCYA